MKVTLLHHPFGTPSALKLETRLKGLGVNLFRTSAPFEVPKNTDILIRWGHAGRCRLKRGALEVNSLESIELGSNKLQTRQVLQDDGISVPQSYFSKQEVLNQIIFRRGLTFPLIGRPSYHTQGKEVEFIENEADLNASQISEYFSEFIAKDREFRVYVFGNKSLGVVEKLPENRNDITWNRHRGAKFIDLIEGQYPSKIIQTAIQAAKVIGQYFSGVDLMTYKGRPYIIELNSSIGLSNNHRVNIFVKAFKSLIDSYNL